MQESKASNSIRVFGIVLAAVLLLLCAWYGAGLRDITVFRTQTIEGTASSFVAREEVYERVTLYIDAGVAAYEADRAGTSTGAVTAGDTEVAEKRAGTSTGSVTADDTEAAEERADTPLVLSITDVSGNVVWEYSYEGPLPANGAADPLMGEGLPEGEEITLIPGETYQLAAARGGVPTQAITVVLYGSEGSILPVFFAVAFLLLAAAGVAVCVLLKGVRGALMIAVTIALLLEGAAYQIAFKPPGVPDEPSHFMTAYRIADRLLPEVKLFKTQGLTDLNPATAAESGLLRSDLTGDNAQNIYQFLFEPDYGNTRIPMPTAEYLPVNTPVQFEYVPPALVIAALRAAGASYRSIFIGGRMVNLLIFLLVVLLAMRLSKSGAYIIAAIAVLPSVVRLAGSYSYDTWNLAFLMLFTVYCLRLREEGSAIGLRQVITLAVLFALFAPVKYIYVVAGLAVFFLKKEQWKDRRILYGCAAAAALLVIVVLVTRGAEVYAYLFSGGMDPRAMTEGTTSYTLSWVIRHPLKTLMVFAHTLFSRSGLYLRQMMAGEFYDMYDAWSVQVLFGILFLQFAITAMPKEMADRRVRVVSWVVILSGTVLIFASLLFTFSTRSVNEQSFAPGIIAGVQGRYFVPLLMFLPPVLYREDRASWFQARGWTAERLLSALMITGAAMTFIRCTARL